MTRIKKFLVSGLLVLVSCCTFLGSAITNFAQSIFSFGSASASTFNGGNTNTSDSNLSQGNILTVNNIPTSAKRGDGETVSLPFYGEGKGVSVTDASGATVNDYVLFVEITDPYGRALTTYNDADATASGGNVNGTNIASNVSEVYFDNAGTPTTLTLNPSTSGMYSVKYHVKSVGGVWTSSREYSIYVSSDSYDLQLISNDSIVMPSTVRIDGTHESESWADTTINVALPLLYDNEGNLIEEDVILGDMVTVDGTNDYYYVIKYTDLTNTTLSAVSSVDSKINTYESYKTYTIRRVLASEIEALNINYTLKINVNTVDNNALTAPTGVLSSDEVVYEKNPFTFEAVAGDNVIDYTLYANDNSQVLDYLTYTITGDASYDSENIDLRATPQSTVSESSASVEQKIYLPSVTATNATDSNNTINAFYYYTVRAVDSSGVYHSGTDYVTMGKDEGGFYFIPHGTPGTRYEIFYNVVDFYGNTVEVADNHAYTIRIRDRKTPEFVYTNSYDVDSTSSSAGLEDISYKIPSTIYVDTEAGAGNYTKLTIPAIWATDESGIDLVTRTITSSNATFIDNEGKNRTGSIYITDNNGKLNVSGNTGIVSTNFTLPTGYSLLPSTYTPTDGEETETTSILSFEALDGDSNYYYDEEERVYKRYTTQGVESDTDEILEDDDLRDLLNSRVATITLDPKVFGEGTYTLRLQVRDSENNSNTSSRTFTFEIVHYAGEDEKPNVSDPTIRFGNVSVGNVTSTQAVSIPVPSVSDINDSRLLVKYFLKVGETYIKVDTDEDGKNVVFNMDDKVVSGSDGFSTLVPNDTDDSSSTLYTLATTAGSNKVELLVFAYNDFADYSADIKAYDAENTTYDGIARASYSISVRYVNDSRAPKFETTNSSDDTIYSLGEIRVNRTEEGKNGVINQYEWVNVDGVTFYDDTNSARIYASVTDTQGNEYAYEDVSGLMRIEQVSNAGGEGYNYRYTFDGIRFRANNADAGNYYTVTYTLVDDGNNVVSYSFVLVSATDKTPPVISGIDGSERTLELGSTLYLNDFEVKDNNTETANISFDITVKNSEGRYFSNICRHDGSQIIFYPTESGTYTITIVAVDDEGNRSDERTLTVNVEDTINPIINTQGDTSSTISILESQLAEHEDDSGNITWDEVTVTLPRFTVEDSWPGKSTTNLNPPMDIGFTATGSITVDFPRAVDGVDSLTFNMNGELITEGVTNSINFTRNENGTYTFNPQNRGKYTVTYNAVDLRGNEADAVEKIVSVGDTENPVISLSSALDSLLEDGFVLGQNNTLTINPKARIRGDENYNVDDLFVSDNVGFDTLNDAEDSDGSVSDPDAENNYNYVNVTISISGGDFDREETDEGYYVYTFKEAGTYTITLTVEDGAGNDGRISRTFEVKAEPTSTVDVTTILGTVLIVVSAVILAGVVIYFVRGTKMLPKKAKAGKDKKTKEEPKDNSKE